jgi:phage terminase large subunit
MLVKQCVLKKTRVVCIREVQNSLKESVRQLVVDKIAKFGLNDAFEVLEAEIRGPHGSLIIFRGMQAYNAETIKSLEGYDIAYIEEAQTMSHTSLRMLRPTIRAPGSEIWAAWNPRHDTDPIDEFFRGAVPPSNAIIERVNWDKNPWFPNELKQEMLDDRARNPEAAINIWDGGYELVSEGSYYALLISAAENEGRIGDYPYDPALPVLTAWDIGVDDYTAIWFLQENGNKVRAIDYFETSGQGVPEIIMQALPELVPSADRQRSLEVARSSPFAIYGRHYLPHDVKVREWGAGRSRLQTLRDHGVVNVNIGIQANPSERINAGRNLMPHMYFNKVTCDTGIKRIRNYSRRFNRAMETYSGPLHDTNSHGADAYGEFAVNCRLSKPKIIEVSKVPKDYRPPSRQQDVGFWA